ncbi:hypothetical protein NARC_10317 [Candidatus Nitrosocosmicus arcticus]|uniref:Uncharacterized protein n=1 Tax=Candidatus Nitrosocosmicus arcticus TaxID=2035267 RepID=A0A557SZ80_9ARCH|nr:hypothetical protein NARC_10317 [Candidatus Nitrosocosmicus arcticus]
MAYGLPYPLIDIEETKQHILSIYPKVNAKLLKIDEKMLAYSKLNLRFKRSLKSVKARWVLGLKGKCPIEKELSLRYRLKRRFKKGNVP